MMELLLSLKAAIQQEIFMEHAWELLLNLLLSLLLQF